MLRDIVSFTFLQTIINLIRQTIPLISVTVTIEQTFHILHLLFIFFENVTVGVNQNYRLFDKVDN